MPDDTKKCPRCAEDIKAEAKVCRYCGAKFEVSGETPKAATPVASAKLEIFERKGEGVNNRLGAFIVDMFVIGFIWSLFFVPAIVFTTVAQAGSGDAGSFLSTIPGLLLLLLFPVIDFFYFFVLEGMFGVTLGKLIGSWPVSLKVINEDGSRIGYSQAAIRSFIGLVDRNLLGAVSVWLTKKDQRLGDLAAKTLVVDRGKIFSVEFHEKSALFEFLDGRREEFVGITSATITKWLGIPQEMKVKGVAKDGRNVSFRARIFRGATVFNNEPKMAQLQSELERLFRVTFIERLQWWRIIIIVSALAIGVIAIVFILGIAFMN